MLQENVNFFLGKETGVSYPTEDMCYDVFSRLFFTMIGGNLYASFDVCRTFHKVQGKKLLEVFYKNKNSYQLK